MKTRSVNSAAKKLLVMELTTYRKLVRQNRVRPSENKIHKLRIQIQKFLATLEIVASIENKYKLHELRATLAKTKKNTSHLRDLQVQFDFLKHREKKQLRFFKYYLKKRKLKKAKRTKKMLSKVPLGDQAQAVHLLAKNLEASDNQKCRTQAVNKMNGFVHSALQSFESTPWPKNQDKSKSLHAIRRKAKHLFYLGEAQRVIIGKTEVNLDQLKKIQATLGKIQNDQALIRNINKFFKKYNQQGHADVKELKQLTSMNQKKLMSSVGSKLLRQEKWPN